MDPRFRVVNSPPLPLRCEKILALRQLEGAGGISSTRIHPSRSTSLVANRSWFLRIGFSVGSELTLIPSPNKGIWFFSMLSFSKDWGRGFISFHFGFSAFFFDEGFIFISDLRAVELTRVFFWGLNRSGLQQKKICEIVSFGPQSYHHTPKIRNCRISKGTDRLLTIVLYSSNSNWTTLQ